jgi:hypothetical protein
MAQSLTRSQMHALVWSTPGDRLSAQWSVSYPTLKKTCEKYDIPIPPRGHWAKLQAGKPVTAIALPARAPGMSDEIVLGARYWWHRSPSDEELLEPLPAPPTFPDDIAEMREQVRKKIGTVKVGREITIRHPVTARLLAQDEARREKQNSPYVLSWHMPIFENPFEQRRLRLLNALFLALARCGGKAEVRGDDARQITITVYQTALFLTLDRPKSGKRDPAKGTTQSPTSPSRCALPSFQATSASRSNRPGRTARRARWSATWRTSPQTSLWRPSSTTGRGAFVTSSGGCSARQSSRRSCASGGGSASQERERRAKLQQARIDRLLEEAASLRRAADIHAYVVAVKQAVESDGRGTGRRACALGAVGAREADRIDPVKNGRFLQGCKAMAAAKNNRGIRRGAFRMRRFFTSNISALDVCLAEGVTVASAGLQAISNPECCAARAD